MTDHEMRHFIRAAGDVPLPPGRDEARARALATVRFGRRRLSRTLLALAAALALSLPGGALIAANADRPVESPRVTHTPSARATESVRSDDDEDGSSQGTSDEDDDDSRHTSGKGDDDEQEGRSTEDDDEEDDKSGSDDENDDASGSGNDEDDDNSGSGDDEAADDDADDEEDGPDDDD